MSTAYINGKIFTGEEARPFVSAMVVEDKTIAWTGDALEDSSCADRVIDLAGKAVIPGLVDAHMHPVMLADFSNQIACLPPNVGSIEELSREIARVRETIVDGEWIEGWGYDEGKFAEHRSPNRYDLDKGSPDVPVFLTRSCEHIRCVNSAALKIAGITKDTPDPPGGEIDRDENGEPTGVLRENARDLVLPFKPAATEEERVSWLKQLGDLLLSQGIVAVTDMGNLHAGGNYELYKKAEKLGFRQHVSLYYMWDYFMDDPEFDITENLMDYEQPIRIAGLKLIGDGSVSGQTAWVYEPYLNGENCGLPVYSDESMEKAIDFCKRTGCQLSIHAMGGRAIDRVIDRISKEEDWTDGKVPYLRIEHVTEPTEDALSKASAKGFGFAVQPIFEYCEIESYRKNMDEERLKKIYPFKKMLEHGVKVALSTDAPATSWAVPSDPFSNLKAAVTGIAYDGTDIGKDTALDVETAVRLYTKEAAEISGFAGLGMLKPGYLADFAILSEDIFSMDPMRIDEIVVEETVVNGESVYKKER